MKRLILMTVLLAGLALPAFAEDENQNPVQVDDTFTKTKTWLSGRNLTLTGGTAGARDDNAAFSQEAILFYGEAIGNPNHKTPAQRELMAKRAAVVTAQRSLAEYLQGFAIVGDTLVKDGMAEYDVIRSAVSSFVKGSQVVFQEYSQEKDTAIAVIKIGMHGAKGFATAFYEKLNRDPKLKKEFATDKPAFKTDPVKLDEAYDGLIIDATEQDFRPALINRIFAANGEVIYDPAKVSQKVLVDQGCGEYTNSIEKAKAALASRNVKNPLIVKASGSANSSDLQLSDDDAVTVYSANRKGNFLAAAKVAFVLK
ncbi:hypothetical protein [Geotalea toluenoxydans]